MIYRDVFWNLHCTLFFQCTIIIRYLRGIYIYTECHHSWFHISSPWYPSKLDRSLRDFESPQMAENPLVEEGPMRIYEIWKKDFPNKPTNLVIFFCNFQFMNVKEVHVGSFLGGFPVLGPFIVISFEVTVQLDRFLQPPSGSTFLHPGAPGGSRSDNKAAFG